jgi:hypothetical protein
LSRKRKRQQSNVLLEARKTTEVYKQRFQTLLDAQTDE